MRFEQQSSLFQRQVLNEFDNATSKLSSQGALFFRPYYNDKAQRKALNYPFLHAAQCVGNVVSIVYGVYLFGKSILTLQSPVRALPLLLATLSQAANLLLNACNVLLSLCSLGSRSLATLVNGGYVLAPKEIAQDSRDVGELMGALDAVVVAGEILQRSDDQRSAAEAEENNAELVYSFI